MQRRTPQVDVSLNADQVFELQGLYAQADSIKEIRDRLEAELRSALLAMVKVAYPAYSGPAPRLFPRILYTPMTAARALPSGYLDYVPDPYSRAFRLDFPANPEVVATYAPSAFSD